MRLGTEEVPLPKDIDEFREEMRGFTELLKSIVENPEVLAEFDDIQIAWIMEHLEMLVVESRDLSEKIQKLIEKPES